MNFMDIKTLDIANGPGCRVSLFVSGCRRHCKDCFNPESWDFNAGNPFTKEVEDKIIELLKPDYISGLTILGGEPFEVENQLVLHPFILQLRDKYPDKTIWMYTGYRIEDLVRNAVPDVTESILNTIDVLVDGEFISEKKDLSLQYCGSTNQRVIDMSYTRIGKCVCTYDLYDFSAGSSPEYLKSH